MYKIKKVSTVYGWKAILYKRFLGIYWKIARIRSPVEPMIDMIIREWKYKYKIP